MTGAAEIDRRALLAGAAGLACTAAATPAGPGYRVVARDVVDRLGEGLTWSPRRNALIWVDLLRPTLWMMNLSSGAIRSWPMPETIGWIVERAGRDDFIVGLKRGFAILSLDPFSITTIGNPEPERERARLNDAKVDRWGRIWAGTHPEGGPGGGSLYRLDPDLRWTLVDPGYEITNGPTFSLDGRTIYHADSGKRLVYAMTIGGDGGIVDKRVFLRFTGDEGVPDGMTTDARGGIWICLWDAGKVSRYLPDGRLDRSVSLPAARVTTPCFAGPGARRLFVGSSSGGRNPGEMAGSLFEILKPGVAGRAPMPFAG